MSALPQSDLDEVFRAVGPLWERLRGTRLFITGGTGFFGKWLLESFVTANDRLELAARCTVLTRDAHAFGRHAPHLAKRAGLEFAVGDLRDFAFPQGAFTHIIHAATPATMKSNHEAPLQMFDTIVQGTQRMLEFARQSGTKRFLFTSSGAIYGKQPTDLTHVPEDFMGGPDPTDPRSAYGEGKRAAEMLGVLFARRYGFDFLISRGFAFVGPGLPLDAQFAVGNFIRDGLAGGPIHVGGDGTPFRSYLYSADLAVWLWTILLRGQTGRAYNTGSAIAHPILEIAREVGWVICPSAPIEVQKITDPGKAPERYVPSVERAEVELGLRQTVDLAEAIRRTAQWHRLAGGTSS